MSHNEETVLRTESGINLNKKGDKKYTFNPPGGTLILTDQRLIFAQSGGIFAKRLLAGGVLGGIVGSEAMRLTTKVKKEELDEAFERPDSFEVHLQDITEVKEKTEWGAHLLIVASKAPGMQEVQLFRQGGVSGLKGFNDWITDTNAAKQRAPSAAQAPQYAAPPQPQYSAPQQQAAQPPQGARFCPNCGETTVQGEKFCKNCGKPLQAPQQSTCPRCGNPVTPGYKFCANCGAPL